MSGRWPDRPGQARVVTDRPGRIVVDVAAPGRQLLALSERYHDGWTAVRNGIPLPTVAIHGDFLGCVVDGGRTRVEFRFEPRSFTIGRAMTALGLLLLVASVAVMSRTFSP